MRWRCSSAGSLPRAASSWHGVQGSLLEETIEADLEAIAGGARGAALGRALASRRRTNRSAARCRRTCRGSRCATSRSKPCAVAAAALKRIGEDVSEKLDYTPGVFHVERHIRGKWACAQVPDADPGAGAGAGDRQGHTDRRIARAGAGGEVCRSPTAVSAGRDLRARRVGDPALDTGAVGRCVRGAACSRWSMPSERRCSSVRCYTPTRRRWRCSCPARARRIGPTSGATARPRSIRCAPWFTTSPTVAPAAHPQAFLEGWSGKLVCDDYAGYKGLFTDGRTEVGCLAHARRKFHDLWVNHKSPLAEEALKLFGALYDVEREARELSAEQRQRLRAAAIASDRRQAARMAAAAATAGDRRNGHRQGDRLQPWSLAGADPIPRRRHSAHRQQLGRESDPSDRARTLELAVRRIAARGKAGRGGHEPDSIGAAQRTRSVPLPQGRARTTADSTGEPHRRIAAAQLDGGSDCDLIRRLRARCVARTVTKQGPTHLKLYQQQCVYRNKEYRREIERTHFVHTRCTRPLATA